MSANPVPSEAIWYPGPGATHSLYARHEFIVSGELTDAWIQCAASAPFRVFLNGEPLGTGLGPALAATPAWERLELTPLLQKGANVLVVFVAGEHDAEQPWLRARGGIDYRDGASAELGSGPLWSLRIADTWQRVDAPPIAAAYAANLAPAGWEAGRPDDGGWRSACVVPGPEPVSWEPRAVAELEVFATEILRFGEVEAHVPLCFPENPGPMGTCKCVRREAMLRPARQRALVQTRDPDRAAALVLDLGRVLVGYPRLRLQGPAGGVIELGFARQANRIDAGLRYVSAEGRQEWTSHQLQACRFVVVRLWNWPDPVELDCVSLVERRVLMPAQNHFSASPSLAAAWDAGHASLNACRQEVYRLGPAGAMPDWLTAGPLALNGYALHADYQTPAAMLCSSAPPAVSVEMAHQALAYVLFIGEYFQHSGDRELLERFYPRIRRIVAACDGLVGDNALLPTGGRLSATALNALYVATLHATSRLARAVGERDTSKELEQQRARVRRGIQQAWDPEMGLFADAPEMAEPGFSQWANALLLLYGLARPRQVSRMVPQLQNAAVVRVSTSLEAFHLSGGLFAADADLQAMDVVEQHWCQRLEHDGPTWAEKWGVSSGAVVLGPEYHLAAHVLGLQPAAPGYQVLRLRPQPSGLGQASGQLLTARGTVRADWRLDGERGRFWLEATVPQGGETHLSAPRLGAPMPTLTLNGETLWRNEKMYPNEHVREVISEENRVTLVLQQGGQYDLIVD